MLITTTLDTEPTWKARPETRSVAHAVKQANPKRPKLRTWTRRVTITILGMLGIFLGGATYASAAGMGGFAVWDYKDDATAYIVNFCGPREVPTMSSYEGVENAFGLNKTVPEGSEARKTYLHNFFPDGEGGDGSNSAQKMEHFGFIDQSKDPQGARSLSGVRGWANNPSFVRYGFNLDYFTYGNSCGDIQGMGMNLVARLVLIGVQFINLIGMLVIHLALDNFLYDLWSMILTPFISTFGAIFLPFMLMAGAIGPVYIWFRARGNTNRAVSAMVWVFCVMALTGAITQKPAALFSFANNAVTTTASFAANQMFNATNYTNQACNAGGDRKFDNTLETDGDGGISSTNPWQTAQAVFGLNNTEKRMYSADQCILENLWYGVSYQTWINGELSTNGEAQARYGPALLNSLYIGEDNADKTTGDEGHKASQVAHNEVWNEAGYMPHGNGTKNDLWGAQDQWNKSNFLSIIAAMCGNGRLAGDADEGNDHPDENAWSNCMAGDKDTTDQADRAAFQAMTGADWRGRMIVAFTGLVNAFIVLLTAGLVAIYLMFKKLGFYFLLLFLPIFMAIGVWPGSRGKRFFWKYWELSFANIMQQAVAVILLLFISYLFALVMAPNAISGLQLPFNNGTSGGLNEGGIPYLLKPFLCIAVLIGLITFAIPFRKMAKAAVAGNVDEFARYAKPGTYGKGAAKVAVVAGTGAVAAGGLSVATTAAKVAGSKAAASAAAAGAGKMGAAKAGLQAGARVLSESPAARKGALKMLDTARRFDRARGPLGKMSAAAHGFMGMQATSRELREEVAQNAASDIDAAKTAEAKKEAFNLGVEGIVQSDPERFGLNKQGKDGKAITYSRDGRDGSTAIPKSAWNDASEYLETELSETHPKIETQRMATESAERQERIEAAHRELSERHKAIHGSYLPGSPQALEAQRVVEEKQVDQVRREASAAAFEQAGAFANSKNYVASGGELLATPISTVYQQHGLGTLMGDLRAPETDAQRAALIDNLGSFMGTVKNDPALLDMSHPAANELLDYLSVSPSDPSAMSVAQRAQDAVATYGYPGFVESLGTAAPPESWKNQTAAALMSRFEVNSWDDRVQLGQDIKNLAFSAPYDDKLGEDEQLATAINHLASKVMNTTYGAAELNLDRERLLQSVFEYEGHFTSDGFPGYSAPEAPLSAAHPMPPSAPSPEGPGSASTPPPPPEAPRPEPPQPPTEPAPQASPTPVYRLDDDGQPQKPSSGTGPGKPSTSALVTGAAAGAAAKGILRPKKHRKEDADDQQQSESKATADSGESEEQHVVTRSDDQQATKADSLFEGTRKRGLSWVVQADDEDSEDDDDSTSET